MNNNHKPIQYRQGDVFIERISETPQKTIEVSRDGGRVILAYGEATGHAHAISTEAVILWKAAGAQASYLDVADAMAMLTHDEHATIPLPRGTYVVERQREYTPKEIRHVTD